MTGKQPNDFDKNQGKPNPTKPEGSREATRTPNTDAPRNPPSTQPRDKKPAESHASDTQRDATQRGMPDQNKSEQHGKAGQNPAAGARSGSQGMTQGGHGTANPRGETGVDRGAKSKGGNEDADDERQNDPKRVNDAARRGTTNKGQERVNEDAAE